MAHMPSLPVLVSNAAVIPPTGRKNPLNGGHITSTLNVMFFVMINSNTIMYIYACIFRLQCEPSQLNTTISNWGACPSMQCEEVSGSPYIGNTTSLSNCNRSTCAYAGYDNKTIFTSPTTESTCPASPPSGNNSSKIDSNWNFLFICVFTLLLCFYLS
ncbi:hypothetical protein SLEP1_g33823 [Rubroshorea leprosula]|uniref:Uncharacterized protein n=1 Tax=Rubroshorea leprosula TaxID=152421 RepID=A0AAV5KI38_9ROSI|nr:hypothetical protein SLEP1_g33823 [Rubroshorea leprosula]